MDNVIQPDKHIFANVAPPYLLVLVGPTATLTRHGVWLKVFSERELTTYDAFYEAKLELRRLSSDITTRLIPALAVTLGTVAHNVRFVPLDAACWGETPDSRIVHDQRSEVTATGYTSHWKSNDDIARELNLGGALAQSLDPKVANFLSLGLLEADSTKAFLYLFLAVEVETHRTLKSLEFSTELRRMLKLDQRLETSQWHFFEQTRESCRTLGDRFLFCASWKWTHLLEADVEQFRRLKKLRNDLAHGTVEHIPESAVVSLRSLALKIHRVTLPTDSVAEA